MKRYLLIVAGSISLALGIIGIFLPVLPTTPFLLLSAACWLKSSQRLYDWLLSHPRLGKYISDFMVHKAIPLRIKIISVSLLWITLLYCAIFVTDLLWLRILFIAIAIGVTIHILSFKTRRKS
ncbi:MAG: DUF454 domain-containing protein [Bacteroidales bacterium]|nr:DUF454 domain-containing protein [Bacteroidales bacterium]